MSLFRRPIHAGFVLLMAAVLGASACGRHAARARVPVAPARIGSTETGVASWYGIPYHGRHAASGEIFDMNSLTAAHRKLPFQTWVEVTNLSNGKRVDVRINDRGPFARGRILDLSQAAARDIDMLRPGTARVRLKVIARPTEVASEIAGQTKIETTTPVAARMAPLAAVPVTETAATAAAPIDWYAVQAGAFADPGRAEVLRRNLEDSFMDARVVAGDRGLWRVLVGRELTQDQANELAVRVRKQMGVALVVREPEFPILGTATPK